jgi:hypothetical protein
MAHLQSVAELGERSELGLKEERKGEIVEAV